MNQFFNIAKQGSVPKIYINGVIGEDADFASFRLALSELIDSGCKRIKLIINSAGGSMTEGFAMYDMLKASGMTIEVEVLGMAASMAGLLAQVASPGLLGIHSNASIMTHKAQSGASGESSNLRSMADFADKLEQKAKAIFAARTKATDETMKDWFAAGTMKWFNAQEAVAAGLADYIIKDATMVAAPQNFTSVKEAFAFYNTFTPTIPLQTENNMKKLLITMLATAKVQHALTEESSDADFSVLFQSTLSQLAVKDQRITELEGLVKDANKTKAAELVENAIKDGKIKAESKDTYVTMATENFDTVKTMFDGLTGRVDVKNQITLPGTGGKDKPGGEGDEKAKTYNQYSEDELRKMMVSNFDQFNALFKAEYGSDYKVS